MHRQFVALANIVIIEVVRWRDFHAASSKLGINVIVGDNRNSATNDWQDDFLSHKIFIALVIRMNRDGAVTQHRFRACSRNNQVSVA